MPARAATRVMEEGDDRVAGARSPVDAAMDRYADGDDAAFARVYDGLAPRIRRLVRYEGGSASLADDVVQGTVLRIVGARSRWISGASVLAYAVVIARRQLVDCQRRGRRELLDAGGDDRDGWDGEGGLEPASDQRPPDEELDVRRRDVALRRALAALPDRWRRPFELVRLLDLSVAEAAEALDMSEGMVKIGAFRAGRALREADRERGST